MAYPVPLVRPRAFEIGSTREADFPVRDRFFLGLVGISS